jgi:uncharacterized lipoprotein YmbA
MRQQNVPRFRSRKCSAVEHQSDYARQRGASASPLANNITRVVVGDLVTMLGTPRVSSLQDGLELKPDYQVAIAVQAFVSTPGEAATLDAIWSVRRIRDDKAESGRTTVSESSAQAGYDALVAAHSRALGRLSQNIADRIRSMESGTP